MLKNYKFPDRKHKERVFFFSNQVKYQTELPRRVSEEVSNSEVNESSLPEAMCSSE